jgi:hypothetical protein
MATLDRREKPVNLDFSQACYSKTLVQGATIKGKGKGYGKR